MEDAGPRFTTPEAGVWDGTTFMMGPVNTPDRFQQCLPGLRLHTQQDTHGRHTCFAVSSHVCAALQIHPRSKHIVGRRMALAAASTAYDRTDLVANGPTLKNCSVVGNSVQIFFDEERLQDDAVYAARSTCVRSLRLPPSLRQF